MLDEEHERLPKDKQDTNSYILDRLSRYNVVIASLPEGSQGTMSAATVAIHLARTFLTIELRLLVGIGETCRAGIMIFALGMSLSAHPREHKAV